MALVLRTTWRAIILPNPASERQTIVDYEQEGVMECLELYELVFWGGTSQPYEPEHGSFEEARDEARRVLALMEDRASHPAIIYGPHNFEKTIR